jgi:hypothetical protein
MQCACEHERQQPREHRDLGAEVVWTHTAHLRQVFLCVREGVQVRALWSVLVTSPILSKPEKKNTSSFTEIKDTHPGFENRDYILQFYKDNE